MRERTRTRAPSTNAAIPVSRVSDAGPNGAVRSVCGAAFAPVAVFNFGSRTTGAPDPRVCADCQILEAALRDSQRTP